MIQGLTLVIPEKGDEERDAVGRAWEARGGAVVRLGRFWDPPALPPIDTLRLYGNDTFCLVLAQKLGLSLVSPPDDLILALPPPTLGRRLERAALRALIPAQFPTFAKPLVPKRFAAGVYASLEALAAECQGLEPDTAVLLSEIVKIDAEARAFVAHGQVLDCGVYEGSADPGAAGRAAANLVAAISAQLKVSPLAPEPLGDTATADATGSPGDSARPSGPSPARSGLPSALVMDVGLTGHLGWVVIEFNAAWGAGLNGCDADRILPAIEAATRAQ